MSFNWGRAIKLGGAVAAAATAFVGVLSFFYPKPDAPIIVNRMAPFSSTVNGTGTITNNFVFQPNTCVSADGWDLCAHRVKDKRGVPGNLITVVSNDIYWKRGSSDEFEYNGRKSDLRAHIRSDGISAQLKKFNAIIAVGAASYEVTSGIDPVKIENDRAYERGRTIQKYIKENIVTDAALFVLSLGKNKNVVAESRNQRLIVILGIADQGDGFDIKSALRDELRGIRPFPFDLDHYSDFQFKPARN